MNYYIFFSGFLLLNLAIFDLTFTALSPNGAGFITGRFSKIMWKFFLLINRNTGSHKLLNAAGAIITGTVLANWLILIWAACTIMICSDEKSVMNVESNTPAKIVSKIYYTGYTLSTMGNGDMEPGDQFWEFFTALFSFSGLVLISIAITYLIPVLSAEIEKRRLSVYITTLGCSTVEILENAWNGHDLKDLEAHLGRLTSMIILHAQNHNAYPILHFYHTSNKKEAFVLNLTNLDEALTIMLLHIPEGQRPKNAEVYPLRKAISSYLVTIKRAFVGPAHIVPDIPKLEKLENIGIPLQKDETKIQIWYEELQERRKVLMGLIRNDGWTWKDLDAGSYDKSFDL